MSPKTSTKLSRAAEKSAIIDGDAVSAAIAPLIADDHFAGDNPGSRLPRVKPITGYKDPYKFSVESFKLLMLEANAHGASDVFIQPGLPICARINGRFVALTNSWLDDNEVSMILSFVSRETASTDLLQKKIVDARCDIFDPTKFDVRGGKVRYSYRVNASPFMYRGNVKFQIVMRSIPADPPRYQDLGLSDEIMQHVTPKNGLVYVAGATGSGKTTTFASVIRYILEYNTPIQGNLLTHEDPIEFSFDMIQSAHSILIPSEIPTNFSNYEDANRAAMRRKPGLVMIGEMRDQSTIRAAIELALTGHPVFGTVHASDVAAIPRRLISRFAPEDRPTAIFDIIETAQFFMAQRLVPGLKGKLIAAREWLKVDEEVRNELLDVDDMARVTSKMREMVEEKGHSFRAEAERLLDENLIDSDVHASLCVKS